MFHSYLSALSESSNSALQVLLQGENRLELWLCKKPFFPEVFLLSCSVFLWNSLSSSSVREMQFSLFSEFSCHPIAFSNLCSASKEWERTSPSSSIGKARPFWWQLSSPFSFGSGVLSSSKPSDLSQALLSEKSPFPSSSESPRASSSCQ